MSKKTSQQKLENILTGMIMKIQHYEICGVQWKVWLEGNCALKCLIRKEKLKISNSSTHLKTLGKEQEIKLKEREGRK